MPAIEKIKTILLPSIFLAAVLALLLPATRTLAAVTVDEIKGTVEVAKTDALEWTAAKEGMSLREGMHLRTKRNSEAILKWTAGHTVKVSQLSIITVSELLYDEKSGDDRTQLDISSGRILAKAEKLSTRDSVFEVKTPTATAAVRGTRFVVDVQEDVTSLIVLEGSVSVISEAIEVIVEQNFQSVIEAGMAPSEPAAVPDDVRQDLNREINKATGEEQSSAPRDTGTVNENDITNMTDTVINDNLQEQILYDITTPNWGCCNY